MLLNVLCVKGEIHVIDTISEVTLGEIKLLQSWKKSCLTVRKLIFKEKRKDTFSELLLYVILNSVEKVN
jgi:hypothetical protein